MTEEWQKRDTWEEKEGAKDGRTGNEERTVGMKEAWIFSRFERAKRWGSICRKIDWTGVTFALVFARVVILDRRAKRAARDTPEKFHANPFDRRGEVAEECSTIGFFFFWKTFVRIVNRKILLRNQVSKRSTTKDVQNFRSTMLSSPRKRVGYQSTLNVLNERGQTTCQTHQPPRKLGESAGIKVGGIGCTASFEN